MTRALMIITIISWALVFGYSTPAALAMLLNRERRWGDPARLLTLAYSFLMISFTARRLMFPGDDTGINLLFTLSIGVAAFTFVLMRSYGRGRTL